MVGAAKCTVSSLLINRRSVFSFQSTLSKKWISSTQIMLSITVKHGALHLVVVLSVIFTYQTPAMLIKAAIHIFLIVITSQRSLMLIINRVGQHFVEQRMAEILE
jgi:hypothetical protein